MSIDWPVTDVDTVRRLHILAAAVPGAVVTERVVDAPLQHVWQILTDFPGRFTEVQPDMSRVEVLERHGERVVLRAVSSRQLRARLRGIERPGWCWLQSRFLIVAMAAREEADGRTRVALTGGVRVPRRAAIVPVGVRREARRSLDRLETLLRVVPEQDR